VEMVQKLIEKSVGALERDLEERLSALGNGLDALETKYDALENRLDVFTGVFAPATKTALLETAVYQYVKLPNEVDTGQYDKTKHGASIICSRLLEMVVTGSEEDVLSWQGPNVFPSHAKLPVILQGLHGLFAYIENAKTEDLENWETQSRNQLAHNGKFLEALIVTPEGKKAGRTDYAETKVNVNAMRKNFADREASLEPFVDLDQGLQSVTDALEAKGFVVAAGVKAHARTQLWKVCVS
jgi:hypothetical protein